MLTCRDISELGSAIIEEALEQDTAQAVSAHLRGCPRCEAYLQQLWLTSRLLQGLELADSPVDAQAIARKLQNRRD